MALGLIVVGVVAWLLFKGESNDMGASGGLELLDIGGGFCLRADAGRAFIAMRDAAAKDGVSLPVNSAYRTDAEQQSLLDKLGQFGQGGLAAAVGTSPHQKGIALDIGGVNRDNPATYNGAREAWLIRHSESFGWYRVGVHFSTPEPWHFEYKVG